MKTLLLLRNAKSSWKDSKLKDRERPITKKGRKAAALIGELIKMNELQPELLLSSSVVRANQTTQQVIASMEYTGKVFFLDHLFMAEADVILDALSLLPDELERVMVVGHNPGLESLLQLLTGQIESLSPGALAHISLPVQAWRELKKDTDGELVQLWRPKEIDAKDN